MLFRLLTAAAALVVLGSVDHGTTRTWQPDALGSGSVMTEGAGRWAAWTFLLGLLALAAARWWAGGPHLRTWLGAVVVPACWTAAYLASRHWLRLLEEQERPREYALQIALG